MPFVQVTLAQLTDELKARWERQPFWTDEEARLYLNHALRTWNLLTGTWQKTLHLLTPAPPSPWLALPASGGGGITYSTSVQFLSFPALDLSSISELDRLRPNWRAESTASGSAGGLRPRKWAPLGLTQLALWPFDAQGGQSLLISGAAATPVLTLPADFVDLGQQEHHAIVGLALLVGQFKRGLAAFQASQACLTDFLAAATEANDRLRHSLYFRKALGLDKLRGGKAWQAPAAPTPPEAGSAGGAPGGRQ